MQRGPTDTLQTLLKNETEAEYILTECEEPQTSANYLPSNANLKSFLRTEYNLPNTNYNSPNSNYSPNNNYNPPNNNYSRSFSRSNEKRVYFSIPRYTRSCNNSFSDSSQTPSYSQNSTNRNNTSKSYKNVQCFYCQNLVT
jgi:hypothetical protein